MMSGAVEFHPLTAERWDDLVALFGPKGASGGCWCMFQRVRRRDFDTGQGAGNKAAFKERVDAGPPPGVLAYDESGQAIGWCSVAPRSEFVGLATSRVLAPVDDAPVWSVHCFYVAREHRRQGLAITLLTAAADVAKSRGATILEGYPVAPKPDQKRVPFSHTGVPKIFEAAGFREVARRSPTRPIYRRAL